MEYKVPEGFEVVEPAQKQPQQPQYAIPEGFEPVDDAPDVVLSIEKPVQEKSDIMKLFDIPVQAVSNMAQAGKYSVSKMGAGINAVGANMVEAFGGDAPMLRDNQRYWQESAQNADIALSDTYDSELAKSFLQESMNPINYTGSSIPAIMLSAGVDSMNRKALDPTYDKSFIEGAGDIAFDTGLGGAIGGILNRVTNFGSEDARKLKALADKYGVELSPASLTGSPNLARVEHNINEGMAGGLGMTQTLNREKDTIDRAIYTELEKMGANVSNINAGETFAKTTQEMVDREKEHFSKEFGKLFASYGDAPVFSIRGVKGEAQKLVEMAKRNPIIKNTTAYRDALALTKTADDLSWKDWQALRTQLGALTQDKMVTGSASTASYKNLYSKLEEDLRISAERTGDRELYKQYKTLVDQYKGFKFQYDDKGSGSRFIKTLLDDKVNPEAIGHLMNNSSLRARSALGAGGVDMLFREGVQGGIPNAKKVSATDVLMSSKAKDGDGIWLPNFVKYTDREGFREIAKADNRARAQYNPKDALLGHYQIEVPTRLTDPIKGTSNIKSIDDLRTLANAVIAKNSYKNNSKTAQYTMLNSLKSMNPFSVAKVLVLDGSLSVAYRSDLIKQLMSTGIITRKEYVDLTQNLSNITQKSVQTHSEME